MEIKQFVKSINLHNMKAFILETQKIFIDEISLSSFLNILFTRK